MSSFVSSPPVIGIFAIQGAVEEHANCVKKCGGHVKEIRMPKDFDGVDGIILPGGESTTMAIVGERWGLFPKLRDWVSEHKPIWGTCAGMILLSDHAIKQSSDGQSLVGGLDVQVCRNFFGSQMQSCDMEINMDPSMTTTDERKLLNGDAGTKCQAIFIRAPAILSVGPDVEVLASVEARPHVSAKAAVLKLIEEEQALNEKTSHKKRRISTHRPVVDVNKGHSSHSGPSGNFGEADEAVEVFVAVQKGNILATAFHPELTEDIRWHQYFMSMVQRTRTASASQQVGSENSTSLKNTEGMKGLLLSLECLTFSDMRMDISAHVCPKNFVRELQFVFPDEDLTGVIAIPTMQNAQMELVQVGDEIEVEKDRLLERFMATAKILCEEFIHAGFWCDYIDPCSGLPMIHQTGNKVFSEVDGAQQLLGYNVMNANCCKILLHPQWGSAVYPATIFAKAPSDVVTALIMRLKQGDFTRRIDAEVSILSAAASLSTPPSHNT